MQAVTPTLFPCYSAADRERAAQIAAFVARGADVRIFLEEGEMRPEENLTQKAREARTADAVLVLFSRNSWPSRRPRTHWEDALIHEPAAEGVRIAFAKLDDCVPPRVLAPQFDLSGLPLHGLREVKRWVRDYKASFVPPSGWCGSADAADLEVLGIAIADRPGTETVNRAEVAFEFTRAFGGDFDAVLALECGDRTTAALAGDLAAQLGLRLEGDLDQNLDRLREFCSARRFLLLLYDVLTPPAHELIFGGSCSTLIATAPAAEIPNPPNDPLRQAQYAFTHQSDSGDWAGLCRLARRCRSLTQAQGRLAECYELMQQWRDAAELRGDRAVLDESTREIVWILESWGRAEQAQDLEYRRLCEFGEQMMLAF